MKRLFPFKFGRLALLAFVLAIQTSRAVILYGTGDASCNTTAPTGALAGSGWQYEGQWGGFLGTPIAPQYFVAAQHIGGSVGQTFTFNGSNYTTTAYWNDPNSDLRIWKVSGAFQNYAPLYSTGDEAGKPLVVIGRGTQRGDPVTVAGSLHGWKDGAADGVTRWGQNQVYLARSTFLTVAFTGTKGTNEAYLSSGDSSGAVFVQDGSGVWSLAGINYGIDGPFSTAANGPTFYGAIFDESGLYLNGVLKSTNGAAKPSYFYATRVSSELVWIQSIVGVVPPAPAGVQPVSTGNTSPPQINIQMSGGSVVVSYPTNAVGYTLQSGSFSGNGLAWATVTNQALVNGTNWNVTLPVTGAGAVFRLQSGD